MARIDALTLVGEENRVKMKEEIQDSEGRLATQIEVLETSVDYLGNNNFIFYHDIIAASIPIPKDTVTATTPPSPSSDFILYDLL